MTKKPIKNRLVLKRDAIKELSSDALRQGTRDYSRDGSCDSWCVSACICPETSE